MWKQGITAKDFCLKEPKAKNVIFIFCQVGEINEFFKQTNKEKKWKKYQEKRDKKEQISASITNATKILKKRTKTAIVISVKSHVITVIKKTTMQILVLS